MEKILFACDLDNTLLHSYKHKSEGDLCVEMLHEKEQGFMTPCSIELLGKLDGRVVFVPVTTRSIEQYLRIQWPSECAPEYAVVANGAILLKDQMPDTSWQTALNSEIEPFRDEMAALMPEFSDREKYLRCRMVDNSYLFVYCGQGVSPRECAERFQGQTRLNTVSSGKKVYFFPPEVNKGSALDRLKELLKLTMIISAGDSAIDIPMLDKADIAIVPNGFETAEITSPYIRASEKCKAFSEFVLETVLANT